jgi:hypothetical protein
MTEPYQFPTDHRFRTIAAKIADAVTVAINRGERVVLYSEANDKAGRRCPLGCLPTAINNFPADSRDFFGGGPCADLSDNEVIAFTCGFDDGQRGLGPEAFFELGRADRRRFVAGDQ